MAARAALWLLLAVGCLRAVRAQMITNCKSLDIVNTYVTVNCSLADGEELFVYPNYLPSNTFKLFVKGGEKMTMFGQSFAELTRLRGVEITGTKSVLFCASPFLRSNLVNPVFIYVSHADAVEIETEAFVGIKAPISVKLSNIRSLQLGAGAFSSLVEMSVADVGQLDLSNASFHHKGLSKVQYHHGPELIVTLQRLTMDVVPKHAFSSSFARISLEEVTVGYVRQDAFSGLQISELAITNSTIETIEKGAFASKTLLVKLDIQYSDIQAVESGAIRSAIGTMNLADSRIGVVMEDAINTSSAYVCLTNNYFGSIRSNGINIMGSNKINVVENHIEDIQKRAFVAETEDTYVLNFTNNNIVNLKSQSLSIVGRNQNNNIYKNNYFGVVCTCASKELLLDILGTNGTNYAANTFCYPDEIISKCHAISVKRIAMEQYESIVCNSNTKICSNFTGIYLKDTGKVMDYVFIDTPAIIVFACAVGTVLLITFLCFGGCRLHNYSRIKSALSHLKRPLIGIAVCCRRSETTATSMSQNSGFNYCTEARCLNETRLDMDMVMIDMHTDIPLVMVERATQSLPEELTQELLDSLKKKLDDPITYDEARETINHLYDLIKVDDYCNSNTPIVENIYDLPIPPTAPCPNTRNNKDVLKISVGTKVPSLDKLVPLSPYERKSGLCREYFEPLDIAVHIYAEIADYARAQRGGGRMGSVPDVLAEQAVPRGPFLRAMMHKNSVTAETSKTSVDCLDPNSTIRSNQSISSDQSAKMMNRPLPAKPTTFDPGEGTSAFLIT